MVVVVVVVKVTFLSVCSTIAEVLLILLYLNKIGIS